MINAPAHRATAEDIHPCLLGRIISALLSCHGVTKIDELYGGHPWDSWRASSLAASTLLSASACSLRVAASTAACRSCCPVAQHNCWISYYQLAALLFLTIVGSVPITCWIDAAIMHTPFHFTSLPLTDTAIEFPNTPEPISSLQ